MNLFILLRNAFWAQIIPKIDDGWRRGVEEDPRWRDREKEWKRKTKGKGEKWGTCCSGSGGPDALAFIDTRALNRSVMVFGSCRQCFMVTWAIVGRWPPRYGVHAINNFPAI